MINISNWKEFKVGKIFQISSGDCISSNNVNKEINEELIPYITRGKENNSIDSFVHNKATQKANCITIGTQGATAYYQNLDFISGTGVNILRNEKELNKFNALFLCTALNKIIQTIFKFGYELSQTRLKNVIIKLPSIEKEDGTFEPD